MPRIFGERIMLREYKKEDLAYIRGWVNDPEIAGNLSDIFLYPHSLNATEEFLTMVLEGKGQNQKNFIIADRETGEYIGQIDLLKIDWKNRATELGIVIGKKELLGKGFGTEAILLMQEFVFEQLNLNRFQLIVHDYNVRAYQCYLKCGFKEEGRARQVFFKNGKYTDYIHMSILREEWEERKRVISTDKVNC